MQSVHILLGAFLFLRKLKIKWARKTWQCHSMSQNVAIRLTEFSINYFWFDALLAGPLVILWSPHAQQMAFHSASGPLSVSGVSKSFTRSRHDLCSNKNVHEMSYVPIDGHTAPKRQERESAWERDKKTTTHEPRPFFSISNHRHGMQSLPHHARFNHGSALSHAKCMNGSIRSAYVYRSSHLMEMQIWRTTSQNKSIKCEAKNE